MKFKKIQGIGKAVKKEAFVKLVNAFNIKLSITWLCDYFGVARSTYYRWIKSCTNIFIEYYGLI
ncbi:hypothetical protein CBF31_00860 [Vagococcus fessus]|uniref:Transposase n=1 Tax=Vagococcus fessus TaxID=120370 RepID=A0A430ABS5_9ENTE|nr:hypothetical protein CBF31_00860 [Vagococcus fessus]